MPSDIAMLAPEIKLADMKQLEREVDKTLDDIAELILKDLRKITATWKHQPTFVVKKKHGSREIYTEDDIFRFLDEGTKTRKAVMSSGFEPKTYERQLYSAPGRGGVVFVSKSIDRPGIKSRKWILTLQEKYQDMAIKMQQETIDAWAGRLGY